MFYLCALQTSASKGKWNYWSEVGDLGEICGVLIIIAIIVINFACSVPSEIRFYEDQLLPAGSRR